MRLGCLKTARECMIISWKPRLLVLTLAFERGYVGEQTLRSPINMPWEFMVCVAVVTLWSAMQYMVHCS